nr:MAG TPA: hypothetical protein [Caudoviricetes sp.]
MIKYGTIIRKGKVQRLFLWCILHNRSRAQSLCVGENPLNRNGEHLV